MESAKAVGLLKRIGLDSQVLVFMRGGDAACQLEWLGRLQAAFLRSVPFENQDIHDGRPLDIALGATYAKVVDRHRGGLCFELNSLFADLLLALGLKDVITPACTMWVGGEPGTPSGDHMAVVATVGGRRYLVDVGNGIDIGDPVPLDGDDWTYAEGARYFVAPAPCEGEDYDASETEATEAMGDGLLALWIERPGEPPFVRYSFRPEHAPRESFAAAMTHCESSPDSVFVRQPLATLRTAHGRVSLSEHHLTTTFDGEKRKQKLEGPAHREKLLRDAFGFRPQARFTGTVRAAARAAAGMASGSSVRMCARHMAPF